MGRRSRTLGAKVRRWERRVDDSRRRLSQAKAELAQAASDGAAAGVTTPEGEEAQRLAAARSAGWNAPRRSPPIAA